MKNISPVYLITTLIQMVIGLVEFLLSLRILLKILGASSGAPFVQWVYQTTWPLIVPFQGMFPSPEINGIFVIEFSAVFALVIYMFVGYFLTEALATLAYYASQRKEK